MGSLFSAPVLPADLHTMTERPTTTATSRQSTSGSLVKRLRRTTSSRSATLAVIAAVSAMCANEKTEGLVAIVSSSSLVRSSNILSLGRFAGELRIQGIIHEPPSFQGHQITRTDQANTLTDDVQTRCRRF